MIAYFGPFATRRETDSDSDEFTGNAGLALSTDRCGFTWHCGSPTPNLKKVFLEKYLQISGCLMAQSAFRPLSAHIFI